MELWISRKWMWSATSGKCRGDRVGCEDICERVLGKEKSIQEHLRNHVIMVDSWNTTSKY